MSEQSIFLPQFGLYTHKEKLVTSQRPLQNNIFLACRYTHTHWNSHIEPQKQQKHQQLNHTFYYGCNHPLFGIDLSLGLTDATTVYRAHLHSFIRPSTSSSECAHTLLCAYANRDPQKSESWRSIHHFAARCKCRGKSVTRHIQTAAVYVPVFLWSSSTACSPTENQNTRSWGRLPVSFVHVCDCVRVCLCESAESPPTFGTILI